MFRWLIKPKFLSKCITYVKCIRIRLETIQKRSKAKQKFMKSDIAELLRIGPDYEAYKRAEWLLLEQNMLSCYELIEKFIGCISDHVQDLTKQSECPEECKEAIPSLIYAAARFADLPELRDLRTMFIEKFGNSLEPYINKEFVEKYRGDPPTTEMKIRLLYDIAQEFSIEWDGWALGQRLYNTQPSIYDERPQHDETDKVITVGEHKDTTKGKERETKSKLRKNLNNESWIHLSTSDDETSTDNSSHEGRKGSSSSFGSISASEEEEAETKRPTSYWFIPPPYLKSNAKKTTDSESLHKAEPDHYVQDKTTAISVRRRRAKSIPVREESVYDSTKTKDATTLDSGKGKGYPSQQPEHENRRRTNNRKSYARATSLPTEHTTAEETSDSKGHARAVSDSQIRGGAGHVYPNLPDWDELVARVAALSGR